MSDSPNGPRASRGPFTFRRRPPGFLPLAFAVGILTAPPADTQVRPDPPGQPSSASGEYIHVEFRGPLEKTPSAGGGPDGLRIRAGGVTWELEVTGDPRVRLSAERLAGHRAVAKGTFTQARGAAGLRRVLTATSVVAAGGERNDYVAVTMQGTLRAGVMAIGGETTGVTLTANGVTWELDLGQSLGRTAARLDGRKVIASGELRNTAGIEIGNRMIVTVRKLAPV